MPDDLPPPVKRPRGRPRTVEGDGVPLTTFLPITVAAKIKQLAQQNGETVSTTIRRLLQRPR